MVITCWLLVSKLTCQSWIKPSGPACGWVYNVNINHLKVKGQLTEGGISRWGKKAETEVEEKVKTFSLNKWKPKRYYQKLINRN